MTDGPFRNAELSSRWKQYGSDLVSDATIPGERVNQACHSMLGDVDLKAFGLLLKDLKALADRAQMDLDPVSSVEAMLVSHLNSPLTDIFQKHLLANLRDKMAIDDALDKALPSTIEEWIASTKNRLDEECIRARDLDDMSHNDFDKGIQRNREAFASINLDALRQALTSGDKRAFKHSSQNTTGVDEGPEE